MSERLVKPPKSQSKTDGSGASAGQRPGDKYAARMAKYIPGEVLAGYVAMSGFVASMNQAATLTLIMWWIVFAAGLVLTPTYLVMLSKLQTPWGLHAMISTVAFAVWAYALGGPFKAVEIAHPSVKLHQPQVASIMLVLFTLVAGLFCPKGHAD